MKELHANPWISIWLSPRATIARIAAENPNRSLWVLAAVYGFTSILNLFQSGSLGSSLHPAVILILAAILSPFWGYIVFAICSGLVTWTGKWFKGKGHFSSVRAAYAWSCVPLAVQIPLWLFMAALFGRRLFQNFPEGQTLAQTEVTILFFVLIAKVILAVWSIVIYVNALAEVQHFSIIRAILNIVVAGIIGIILFALFWSLIFYFTGTPASSIPAFHLWHEGVCAEALRVSLSQ